jgi:predicted nucleic acid-binding protein
VVDASVAVKWLVAEEGSEAAVALIGGDLHAPDLLCPEVAHILWKKARLGELSAEEAALGAAALATAEIELHPTRDLLEPATRLALALDHPAYDGFYLALAARLDAPLITADQRLVRRVGARGEAELAGRVRLLGEVGDAA